MGNLAPNSLTLDPLDGGLLADGSSLVGTLRSLLLNGGSVAAQLIFQFPAADGGASTGSLVQLGGVSALRSSPLGPARQDWTSLKAFALTRIELAFSTCQITPESWTVTTTDDGASSSSTTTEPGSGSSDGTSLSTLPPTTTTTTITLTGSGATASDGGGSTSSHVGQ